MLAIDAHGQLMDLLFTNQTLEWNVVYEFNHSRHGKIVARLTAEDKDWYYLELTATLESDKGFMFPGECFPLRKSLVYAVEAV